MKIVWSIVLAISIGWPSAASAAGSTPAIGVTIDGERTALAATPRMIDGTVYVPVRAMFEALGASVEYDLSMDMVTIVKGALKVELTGIRSVAQVGEQPVRLAQRPVRLANRLYAPVRFVGESLGYAVLWHGSAQTVHLLSGHAATGADADFVNILDGETPDELAELLRSHLIDKANFHDGVRDLIKLKLIVDAGADLGRKVQLDTPLDIAVRNRDTELAAMLLEAGADPNARAFDSRSILSRVVNPWYALAGQAGGEGAVDGGKDGDVKGESAVEDGESGSVIDDNADLAMLDLLLDYGADPNQLGTSDGTKDSVLLSAIIWNRVAIVERLLEAGAYANAHPDDPFARSPMEYAAFHDGHLAVVEQFGLDPAQYPNEHPEIAQLLEEALKE